MPIEMHASLIVCRRMQATRATFGDTSSKCEPCALCLNICELGDSRSKGGGSVHMNE